MSDRGPSVRDARQKQNVIDKGIMRTRLIAVFAVALMAASCLVIVDVSDESCAEDPYCGDNVLYFYNPTSKELRITGYGPMWDKPNAAGWPWHSQRAEIESIVIEDGAYALTHLGDYAFCDMSNLTSVTITATVASIGDNCFQNDDKLVSIELPASVTAIGDDCFANSAKLESVGLSSGLTTIGQRCFYEDSKLASITLPDGLTTIGGYAFYSCSKLKSISIPDSVISLGDRVFHYSGLTEARLPSGITDLPEFCFGNTSLARVDMPDTVETIGANAFMLCPLQYIHFSTALTTLGEAAVGSQSFYEDYGSSYTISKTVGNLKGHTFVAIEENKLIPLSDSLSSDGSQYAISSASDSVNLKAVDIAYVRQSAESDTSTTFKFNLNGGISASFDSAAIKSLATAVSTASVVSVDKASLDEKTKELVGNDPVYEITFGPNTNFGEGKMTVTLPYTLPSDKTSDNLRVLCIKGGEVSETIDCTYADGKVTFSTGHLSTYSIGFEESSGGSGGGKFPVWAIVVIVVVILAAAGGCAAFFLMKNKGSAQPVIGDVPAPESEADDQASVPADGSDAIQDRPSEEPPRTE